jgi:peptidoglycan hydrolase-like protein with peptidoglycan-binding domain
LPVAQGQAPSSTPATPAHPPGLGAGDQGPAVTSIQQRLSDLHYDVGGVDGQFGGGTEQGVIAFQKVMGLPRTGRATDDVLAALASAAPPPPLAPGGGADRVEIDLPRQVLFLYSGGSLERIIMISTGSGRHYCEKGECGDALTPSGSYRVGRKIQGLHISPLGQLWNPLFFNGGIAIHGSPSVPTYPASHGCVRIPMSDSVWFFDRVPSGTPVYVVGGTRAPAPVNPPSTATTTPAPATTTTAAPTTTTTTTRPATTTTAGTTAPASTASTSAG